MKIAIINITGGSMSGGYRKYLRNIIPIMASNSAVEAVLCALPQSLNLRDLFDPILNVNFVTCRPFSPLLYRSDTQLHMHLESFSPDVIFVPIERSFRFREVPVVNMIQNMEPFITNIHGDPLGERLKKCVQYVAGKRAVKKTDRVIAISNFVYEFLVKCCDVPTKKIGLVHHGIDIKKKEGGCKPAIIPEGWHDKYMFTAGSIRPARGLEDLLMAMKHIASKSIDKVRLVIAGETGGSSMGGYRKKLKNWIRTNNLSDRICWTGSLNEKEMTWCYQNCGAFVMTSRVEACPNIALEAMSHGCISIAADNPPLPEIFGDTAVYYPPKDGKALAEAIQTVLERDDHRRKVMSVKAIKRASKFSWDVCAEKTVSVLAKAVESRYNGNTRIAHRPMRV